jgi:phospholipid/cholesterol/gamma-HCH transport system permease protein
MQALAKKPSAPPRRSVSGEVVLLCSDALADTARNPSRFKDLFQLTAAQIITVGNESLALVFAAGAATGAVMATQFGNGLQRFGGSLYVPQLVGLSVLRELGPILAALLLAGRVGSGMTAELASMNVTEQIDAIRALGDSPGSSLVLPRILACLITFPILTLFCDVVSIASSMLVSWKDLAITPAFYLSKTIQGVGFPDVWTGMLKALVFALYISTVACWKGTSTTGGTQAVGRSTTWIVVHSSIFILIADFFLSKLFIITGLYNAV